MYSFSHAVLRAAVVSGALLVFGAAPAHAETPAASPAPAALNTQAWPQLHSDIRPDPEVRFGQLPNGMRYAIMHNATPAHETSIRFRIASGSLMEKDDQRGLAHFVEHMAFKGSTHIPSGDMMKLLERHGLAFGADTNAFTTYTQTFYQLDLPESDDGSIDLGLLVMRETASELVLNQKSMDSERGVILSEERDRDTPSYEAGQKATAFLMKGQLVPERSPIGQLDIIRTAPASRLRAFYDANYRPERAALVVIGDVDVDAVEAKIKARFNDWVGRGPAVGEPEYRSIRPRGAEAEVIVQPGVTASVAVAWTRPHDPAPDTRSKEKQAIIENLGLAIINHRLARLSRIDRPPYLGAAVGRGDELRSIKLTTLSVTPSNDDWQGALAAADMVRRQALQYGVQPDELARVIKETRERYRGQVIGKSTRPTPALAAEMLTTLDTDEVYCGPMENDLIFEEAVKGLTPEQVDEALRGLFVGQGPLISMVTPKPLSQGAASLVSSFRMAESQPVKPAEVFADQTWPYTHFGAPGVVTSKETIADLGVTFVTFANGVTLTFKPTHFAKDQVLVGYELPGGRLTLPTDRPTQLWEIGALGVGGMRQISLEDAEQALAGRVYGFNAQVGDDDFVLGASTRRVDLDTELQILTAFLTDPGWRSSGLERLRSASLLQYDQIDSTPNGAFSRRIEQLLHSGDARWANATKSQLLTGGLADAHAIWDRALQGPVNVAMVGDLTLDQAIAAVARTVGSLPPRGPAAPLLPDAATVRFPAPTPEPIRITHKGRPDQAIGYIAWPTADFFANPEEARALSLAAQVMQDRLLERFRSEEGASYSPSAGANPSDTFHGYGMVSAVVETPPTKLDSFFKTVADITADLRDHPISADELERAKRPRIEQVEKAQQTNAYWMARLIGAVHDHRRIEITRETIRGYQAINIADIQAVARKYLRDRAAFKVVVVPESRIASSGPATPSKD
jgi:zinc protease